MLNCPQRCKAQDLPGRCTVQFIIKATGRGWVRVGSPALSLFNTFCQRNPLPLHHVLPIQARGRKVNVYLIQHCKKRIRIPQFRHDVSFRRLLKYFTGQQCCDIFVKVSKKYSRKPRKNIRNKQVTSKKSRKELSADLK